MPIWAAGSVSVAGFLSALGWTLGEHMGVWIGGPVWLISTLVMSLWLVWFGLAGFLRHTRPRRSRNCLKPNRRQ